MRTQHILARSVAAVSILTTGVIGAAEQSASASTPTSATAISTTPTAHTPASRFKLAGNTTGITRVSETDYSDGTALGTWTRAGVTYSASGPTGTVVTFTSTTVKDKGLSKVIPEIAVTAPVDRASKARGIGQASAAFIAADPKMAKAIAAKTNAAKANVTPASSFLRGQ